MNKTLIIAEAGVNHNGRIEHALRMIDIASDAGVDAVKFQTYKAENVMTGWAPKAAYQKETTNNAESQLEMVRKYELNQEAHQKLIAYCKTKGCMFMSTPHDMNSIDLLSDLGLNIFKIPSGEITDLPYLRKIGKLGKKVILSTGMADMTEIRSALEVLVNSGTRKEDITVLHCTTNYPTNFSNVNLLAMRSIGDELGVKVGFSDHTVGIEASVAAVALGAIVIEKHFTLDKNMEGPDHKASVDPSELRSMVRAIRNIEVALGSCRKVLLASEIDNLRIVRKSIVAAKDIKKGELFSEDNITVKRPATGISPMEWDNIIGMSSGRDFAQDELIEL